MKNAELGEACSTYCIALKRNAYWILVLEHEEKISLCEDLGIDDSVILKWTLQKWNGRAWLIWFRVRKSDGLRTAIFWLVWSICDQEAFPYFVTETEFDMISSCNVTCLWHRSCCPCGIPSLPLETWDHVFVFRSVPAYIYLLYFVLPFPTGRPPFQGDLPDILKKIW
jgi:hypothetical protein